MNTQKKHPRSSRGAGLSVGGLALLLLIVFLHWWSGGAISVPSSAELTRPTARPSVVAADHDATPVGAATSTPDAATTRQGERQERRTLAATPVRTQHPSAAPTPIVDAATGQSGLPTIHYDDLPQEAKEIIGLINQGGPFPFERDGLAFQNREWILPRQPTGYYHEYTVITPGENDRGARRIVTGEDGEMYYTEDHYASFREILP